MTTPQPSKRGEQEHAMNAPIDTTTEAADARRQRVEELQRRRSAGTSRPRTEPASGPIAAASTESAGRERPARGGAAQGAKIAAAGLGVAAMFGVVAAIAVAGSTSAATPAVPVQTAPPAQIVVVIHRRDGSAVATAPAGSSAAVPEVVAASPAQPIVLSAQPTVVQAPASQAPAAQTNGSR